jgi:FdhD protein
MCIFLKKIIVNHNHTGTIKTMSTSPYTIENWQDGQSHTVNVDVIDEEPLSIRVQGNPYAVVMRTPGDDLAHSAGFCMTEGLIDSPDDITTLSACDGEDTNVVTVTLTPERRKLVTAHLERRGYISQTSCGICGKTIVEELFQILQPIEDITAIGAAQAEQCLRSLENYQPLHRRSAACHAAVIFDAGLNILVVAEDVGRHNALDKAVGRLFLDRKLDRAKVAVMSSRISYELVQKAARARIPILMGLSRPTSLALNLADQLNITIVGATKTTGLLVFTHPERLSA